MGKSSVVLKLASQVTTSRKYSKKFFVYAVDVRTAMSARYAEMAIRSCFSEADSQGFTDVTTRDINSTTVSQCLNDSSIQKTLEYLKQQGKTIVIVFDQFEELFSQKGLYPLFDNVRVLCNEIDALQGPLVLGFAWKTDLTIPADHPAYYMWLCGRIWQIGVKNLNCRNLRRQKLKTLLSFLVGICKSLLIRF